MTKYQSIYMSFTFLMFSVSMYIHAENPVVADLPTVQSLAEDNVGEKDNALMTKKTVSIHYDNESLVDVINTLAALKSYSVVFPVNAATSFTSKITVHLGQKLTVDEAWDFLQMLLGIAGYNIVQRGAEAVVAKTGKETFKEPVSLFVDVPYEKIPETQEYIRCLFYLSNIKVSDEANTDLMQILSRLLPDNYREACQIDPITNALIITERAAVIKAVMHIVSVLEQTEFKERVEILPLFNTAAFEVAKLFNDTILKQANEANRFRTDARHIGEASYFSKYVKIIPDPRLNVLIILGKEQAIERIRSFIKQYIDVAPESGKSIFHVYHLQYLDASTFAPILRNIVGAEGATTEAGGGQSRAEGAKQAGVERYFEGVRIIDDAPKGEGDQAAQTPAEGEKTVPKPQYFGSNKLIIAARDDDYARICDVLEEVDVPRKQVVLEILVTDLTLEDSRQIGTILRNPINIPLPRDIQGQSAQMGAIVLPNSIDNPKTIGVGDDLLNKNYMLNDSGVVVPAPTSGQATLSVASTAPVGSTVFSFNQSDGETWGVMEVLKGLTTRKVISNPHVIAVDNQPTEVVIGETRLLPDQTTGSSAAAITIPKVEVPATITIRITPRINATDDDDSTGDSVHLSIYVEITDFKSTAISNGDRLTRKVITSAYVPSGYVLPLGGLLEFSTLSGRTQNPLLGRIPIIGYFFKNRSAEQSNTNLTVFICPRVIKPRLRAGMDLYTKDQVKLIKRYAKTTNLFDSLKDPITRWFFKTGPKSEDAIDEFLLQDASKAGLVKQKEGKERRARAWHQQSKSLERDIKRLEEIQQTPGANKVEVADLDARLKQMLKQTNNPLTAAPAA